MPAPRPGFAIPLATALALLVAAAPPAGAKILKTRASGQTARQVLLTVGSGFEYETDGEESDYDYPLLIELGLLRNLELSIEPNYAVVRAKPGKPGTNAAGWGDLETTLDYEFVKERRSRPSFSAESIIKWPTSVRPELGTGERDYALGLIASKEFVRYDVDFNAIYTFVGDPPGLNLQNATELALASTWHLNEGLDLEGEVVYSSGGGLRGGSGSFGGLGNREHAIGTSEKVVEGTLGVAELLGEYLKLEQGVIGKTDGSWQVVLGWEWNFEGNH